MGRGLRNVVAALQVVAMVGGLIVALPVTAQAATFVVNRFDDVADANVGDGNCDVDAVTEDDQCTLRAAVQESEAIAGADSISVPAGTFRLTIPDTEGGPPNPANGDLDISQPVSISGASAATTLIDGGNRTLLGTSNPCSDLASPLNDRLFEIESGGTANLSDLALLGGDPGIA
ncbi:MAG TPA: hypothetical protein VFK89_01785, partial [Actinomycetota bacterium]|nr:hypothetical protein [Actinomycetota bacterium]